MSRFPRRSRSLTRIAVGLVALGVPLLGASSAQGAIGLGVPLTGPNVIRPVLISVTPGLPGIVRYCFSTNGAAVTPIEGSYDPDDFSLGGYDDSFELNPATVEQASNDCVVASFPEPGAPSAQLSQYTYGQVEEDSVAANITGSPQGNEEDSRPFNVAAEQATRNGTRGFSTGPDLQTVLRGAEVGGNRMAFVFDQNVDEQELCPEGTGEFSPPRGEPAPACFTNDFWFYSEDGALHGLGAAIVAIEDNVVVVQYFAAPPNNDFVADATIALVNERADSSDVDGCGDTIGCAGRLRSDTPFGGSRRNPQFSVAVPGSLGNTDDLDLVATETVDAGESNQMTFRFDGNVALTPFALDNPRLCFVAILSNANFEGATGASAAGNTVTATFADPDGDGLQQFSELVIGGSVHEPSPDLNFAANCVQSTTGEVPNTMGGKPAGGNVGAVGTGYTTGPDELGLSFGSGGAASGNLRVRVDQRVEDVNTERIRLINQSGAPYGPFPNSASVQGNGSPYDPHVVVLGFDPSALEGDPANANDNVAGLQLRGQTGFVPAFATFDGGNNPFDGDFDDESNVTSIFGFGGLTG